MTTKELDLIAENQIRSMGAILALKGYRGFQGTLSISLNKEFVNEIPGERKFQEGEVVSIDKGAMVASITRIISEDEKETELDESDSKEPEES